jgi:hypothetical protein
MRKLVVIAAGLVLAVPAAAPAKGWPGVLRICGVAACRIVEGENDGDALRTLAVLTGGGAAGPARPGPFYELAILPLDDRGRPQPDFPSMRVYYTPRSNRVRTSSAVAVDESVWRTPERVPRVVAGVVRRLRPFPAPLLVRVEVDGRAAHDPQSYLRLFRIAAPRRPIADPAGPYPSNGDRGADPGQVVRYWQRHERHWLPVNLSSRRPSPWGDEWTSVWVARRLPLVKRDGEIVRVPRALAERIRRGGSCRADGA